MSGILGQRLKDARTRKNLTQIEVKKLTNINNKTLSGYENDVSEPDLETLKILADIYDISIDWLAGMTDDPAPKQKPPNYEEMVLSAKNIGDALIVIARLKSKKDIPKNWFSEILDKAIDKFGIPEPVISSEPAAHGPNHPGSGIKLDD